MSHLTPADRDRIIGLLASDQPLPDSDRALLFPAASQAASRNDGETPAKEWSELDENGLVPPEQRLCFSLYSTSLAVGKTYWPTLDKFGLTYPQLLALRHIRDGITVNELGAELYLDSGTLTPLLKRLEAAGHLRRERDPKDERRVRLHLTEQGKQLRDDAFGELRTKLAQVSGWSKSDIRKLAAQVSRFRSTLLARAGETNSEESETATA